MQQTAQQTAQQDVRQEAHQYVGSVINFAENQYQSKMGAAKAQADKEAKAAAAKAEKEAKAAAAKAKKEAEAANQKAQKAAQSEHNTEYKTNPSTPGRTARAKAKTGPSPNSPKIPPFPTGENPEPTHEPKGAAGRPPNTQPAPKAKANPTPAPKAKANPTPAPKAKANPTPPVKKDHTKTPTPKAKAKAQPRRPKHDTDLLNEVDVDYWQNEANLTTIRDQLNKRGFRKYKTSNGKRMNKADYLEEVFKMINEGRWVVEYYSSLIN